MSADRSCERDEMRDKLIFTGTIIWIVAAAGFLTVLLAIPLYAVEMLLDHLAATAQISNASLWHNFLVLMNYLLNPLVHRLEMPNFPSSASGLEHFAQVKNYFTLMIGLVVLFLPAFVLFIKENLRFVFHAGLRILMLIPLFMGIVVSLIGFDNFFIYFHEVIFRDDTWVFDPVKDPIINVLPEQYFMYTFILFVLIYELLLFSLYHIKKRKFKL